MAQVESTIMKFIQDIGFELTDSDELANLAGAPPFFQDVHDILRASESVLRASDSKWHGIGGCDAVVASLAARLGAPEVATFDQGFRGLRDSRVRPLMVPDVY
jgi:predicted nucleic acid-binding protein